VEPLLFLVLDGLRLVLKEVSCCRFLALAIPGGIMLGERWAGSCGAQGVAWLALITRIATWTGLEVWAFDWTIVLLAEMKNTTVSIISAHSNMITISGTFVGGSYLQFLKTLTN
jgi:hypothetical protein